jgi:lipopolysaccharide/colanic/teichoic acid biosynthesis glycosyltransferase
VNSELKTDWTERDDRLFEGSQYKDRSVYHYTKRFLDVVIASLALFFLSPFIGLLALLVKLDSEGPVIFKQTRVGASWRRKGRGICWDQTNFECFKLRTMFHDSDQALHKDFIRAYVNNDFQGMEAVQGCKISTCKLVDDPRVTRIGRILRKTSLDELPQLVNIMRGEMSLVGPRPDVPYAVEQYKSWHLERLAALPGLTGLWQIKGRGNVSFDGMVRMDIEYINNQSTLLDLKILLLTVPAVLSRRGAA